MYAILVMLSTMTPAQREELPKGPPASGEQKEQPDSKTTGRDSDAVLEWNSIALEAIRRDRTPPPRAARNLAILHVAIADSVHTITPDYKPYRVALRATEPIDPSIAVAACAHRVLTTLYPSQAGRFNKAYNAALARVDAGGPRSRAVTLGRYVADRILAWRQSDGANRAGVYRASLAVGVWRSTPPGFQPPLYPSWAEVTPFGIADRRLYQPGAPPALTSREYTLDFEEVRLLGARDGSDRTAEQSIIAWFWNDGPGTCSPPGHWNQIAQEAAIQRGNTLPENARLFALLNIALADAGIICWECKYRHRLWRPITAIREADKDGNDDTQADSKWSPLLTTPPFPSYTSGHSTFSGAAAGILEKFFAKEEQAFSIGSDDFPGMKREFTSFQQAADEAGKSRIYGGIHFESDNREGLAMGRALADEVFRKQLVADAGRIARKHRPAPTIATVGEKSGKQPKR